MIDTPIIFEFHPKKITFKAPTSQTNSLHFNLLYNNKKLSNTEPLQIPSGNKQFDLSHIPCLFFDTKNETNKYPIMIYVLYGHKNPAKKIILKSSEMMKKYEIEKKDLFSFQQDFGAFSITYEVELNNSLFEAEQFVEQIDLLQSNDSQQPHKTEETLIRTFKRPQMLQVGAKAEKIRKSSYDSKQQSGRSIKDFPKPNETMLKLNQKNPQNLTKLGSNLTFSKEQEEGEDLVKKDIKVNLFETFNPKHHQQQQKSEVKLKNKHKTQKQAHQNHQSQNHISHKDSHKSTHSSHHESHNSNEHGQSEHHSSHDSHEHGHEESHPLSLKLKTVIIMLIVGFLLLMYDALDDRFSRKIVKKENISHNDDHSDSHHEGKKKKKPGKKQKKIVIH